MINDGISKNILPNKLAIAFNAPSYIPKSGESIYGKGKYWLEVAKSAKWVLDILEFAVV